MARPSPACAFFTVYGPRQRPDLAIHKFTRLIAAGQPISFSATAPPRATTPGSTTSSTAWSLPSINRPRIREPPTVSTTWVARARPACAKLVDRISSALGKQAIIEWKPEEPGDMKHTLADVDLAQGDLGYSPKVSIVAGIPRFVDWFKSGT
jgi:UDP-glucuronate 4-epimerase